ncbi:MAG: hypothetical protein HOP10_06530 [Chitinophagaceae bacterium]|nr:hypothetical protein [Chitinophagaceae bacterium]
MKNKNLRYHYQSAKIYRHYYKSSFNIFRFIRSVFAVFFSNSGLAANHTKTK